MWWQRWEQSQMSLSKYYQNVLTYESVKLIKRPDSMNTLMKVLKLTHLMAKCIGIWLNEHSCKMGFVNMKSNCANVNDCGYNMMWG